MPFAAPKPCLQCQCLVYDGTSRCAEHKRKAGSFADRSRGSRHERGYGTDWDKLRRQVMERDCGVCQCDECKSMGRTLPAHEVDHRVPKARGGTDDLANLQAINRDCHRTKTAREAAKGRGVEKSAAYTVGTDLQAKFSCAGVSGGGVLL